jgi:type IV secretory pathway VirB2 component (pilin)
MKLVNFLLIASCLAPSVALAADEAATTGVDQLTGLLNDVVSLIVQVIDWILPFAGGIVVIMVIIGGIQTMIGQKDTGKKTIIAALVGTAIVVLSYAIVNMLEPLVRGEFTP